MIKTLKKLASIVMSMSMLITMAPAKISATERGEGEYSLSLELHVPDNSQWEFTGTIINGAQYSEGDIFKTNDGIYYFSLNVKTNKAQNIGLDARFTTNDHSNYAIQQGNVNSSNELYDLHPFQMAVQLDQTSNEKSNTLVLTAHESNSDPQQEHQSNFSGTVYFVWVDEDLAFHYHKIENIIGGHEINYVRASTIVDDLNQNVKCDISKQSVQNIDPSYFFCWEDRFEAALSDGNFQALSSSRDKMNFLFENEITIDPTGAECSKNSISTNGDRNFRLTIYNDSTDNHFEGLKLGVPTNYTYFPSFWDPVFFSDTKDISNSTIDNPTAFESYLLEDTVTITSDTVSSNFTSVQALDVPDKAVTITKIAQGSYSVKFNSHFYDKVKFKITDDNGKEYYVIIARVTIQVRDNFAPNVSSADNKLFVNVFYPSTSNYNYYQLVAKINYVDGTSETKILSNSTLRDELGEDTGVYERDGGEGLKRSEYQIPCPGKNVKSLNLTVIEKGAFDSNTTYGGTFAGSGDGIHYDVTKRKIIYN